MICALSGESPQEPVISKKSGYVFEKRLIAKYLESNSVDPITNEPLSIDDLLPVKSNKVVKPRPVATASIPSMLQIFQNEWDAVMLETYTLKQQLDSVRQELSHALYQHDAACRVIARLIKERDEARNALQNSQVAASVAAKRAERSEEAAAAAEKMEVEAPQGITEEIKSKISAKAAQLSKERKNRPVSSGLATADDLKEFDEVSSFPPHKSQQPGITCLDIHPTQQNLVVTGGMDKTAIVFDRAESRIIATLKGHNKKVTDVLFHPNEDVVITTSQDKTAKVWAKSGAGYRATFTANHQNDVSAASLHPTGDYWVSASLDKSWAVHDLQGESTLARIDTTSGLVSINFHPDGLILGTGNVDSTVRIWDIKTQKNVATFEGHKGKAVSLSFSENGYYLATAAEDNTVKLWDLRKLKNIHTISLPEDYGVNAIDWDYSGTYLAVAGADVRVYIGKTVTQVAQYTKHTQPVTDVKFGKDAQFLASTSLDRHIRVWSKKSA